MVARMTFQVFTDSPDPCHQIDCVWSCTAAARTVLSRSCERSLMGARLLANKVHAVNSTVMATQGTAARQRAAAQAAHKSVTCALVRWAMTRFSKAKGTLSLGGWDRAAAISFLCNSVTFIQANIISDGPFWLVV